MGKLKAYMRISLLAGIFFLLSINLFIASSYYFIAEKELSRFFILQSTLKEPTYDAEPKTP